MSGARSHIGDTLELVRGLWSAEAGGGRKTLALVYGLVCHVVFLAGTGSMVVAMYFGMSESFGRVPEPWAWPVNALLILQFPLIHTALLTRPGRRLLSRLAPGPHGKTLATTTYAIIAGVQLFLLFVFWTPSGVVWWRAEGAALVALTLLYGACWGLLLWSDVSAGMEVQTGALGWMAMFQKQPLRYPDMPEGGPFRIIRQPIYLAFSLTLWTVPVWTPDQLAIAVSYTAYSLIAPRHKERRYAARYGEAWRRYRKTTPYMVPGLSGSARDE